MPQGELGRIGLTMARNDPRVVYALVEARQSALLRSDDGGVSWSTVNDERGVASRPFYYADIFVDPSNELRLFNLNSRGYDFPAFLGAFDFDVQSGGRFTLDFRLADVYYNTLASNSHCPGIPVHCLQGTLKLTLSGLAAVIRFLALTLLRPYLFEILVCSALGGWWAR